MISLRPHGRVGIRRKPRREDHHSLATGPDPAGLVRVV